MPFGVSRRDAPPWEGLLRGLGVIFVFMGVVWLFWKHNARTLEMIETQRSASQQVVFDATQTLSEEQKKAIRDLARVMKSSFGLQLLVRVDVHPIAAPAPDTQTIFIGLYPGGSESIFQFPALAERAVGEELVNKLRLDHFTPYWRNGDWPKGLGEALALIWNALARPDGQNIPVNGPEIRGRIGDE